jgi:hypothetical protein
MYSASFISTEHPVFFLAGYMLMINTTINTVNIALSHIGDFKKLLIKTEPSVKLHVPSSAELRLQGICVY